MPDVTEPRFPRIIRLFDRIFAADPVERAFAIFSWLGTGSVLLPIVPTHMMVGEMFRLAEGV